MKKILLQTVNTGYNNNVIFTSRDENDLLSPFRELKKQLGAMGYDLITADNNSVLDCEKIIFKSLQVSKQVFCVMQNRYSPPSAWIKNIIEKLGTKNFKRLRVGVGYERNFALYS